MTNPKKSLTKKEFKEVSLNNSQMNYAKLIEESKITICYGPAGTSKTFSACYMALKLLERGEIEKIILTKPIQESGEKIGFLPGDVDDKIGPFMESYVTNIIKIITKEKFDFLCENEIIEFRPLTYMRGATFDNSIMLLDEAQNCEMKALMLFVTRLGRGSKMVIMGDVTQHDIDAKKVAIPILKRITKGISGVGHFEFSIKDIVREKILQSVVEKYEEWKNTQI